MAGTSHLKARFEQRILAPAVERVEAEERKAAEAEGRVFSTRTARHTPHELPDMTEQQEEFLVWLLDPNRQGSQNQWAKDHGINPNTLCGWKKSMRFRAAWERRLAELNVAPDRIQDVTEAIYRAAVGGDVKAASLYLQYVDRFTPKQRQIIEDKSVSDLSDEELAAEMEDTVRHLRAV